MLKKLFSRPHLPILAGFLLVVGLFGVVMISQQRQESRSRASGTGACNVNSSGDIVGNDCYMPSGFNGSIYGNGNTIGGGMGGSIFGDNNIIQGGLNGCINGNNNEIFGGVNGGVNGTGNIIHGGQGNGPCPNPSNAPTAAPTTAPTNPPATCSDGIDNNQNELIDAQDPACHTDGNQDNPNSYDPSRNEGNVTVTPIVTQGPTVTVPPTSSPTSTPTVFPTVTVLPGNTSFILRVWLHGVGKGGDSANPNSGGNPNPLHPQRTARIEVYNAQNQLVLSKDGPISFNSEAGNFQSINPLDMGTLQPGVYLVKVKTEQFLKYQVPGILNITQPVNNWVAQAVLVNGDINLDNTLNILDYNILMGCYSDFLPAVSCTPPNNLLSDLDDDGLVNQFDYNLFLRELTNREGQ